MNRVVVRILTNGLPAAALAWGLGYGVTHVAGGWVTAPVPGARTGPDPQAAADALSGFPFALAGWAFAITAFLLLIQEAFRGPPKPPEPPKPVEPTTEELLNRLLEKADADRAAAAPCPPPPPADNTPTGGPTPTG